MASQIGRDLEHPGETAGEILEGHQQGSEGTDGDQIPVRGGFADEQDKQQ